MPWFTYNPNLAPARTNIKTIFVVLIMAQICPDCHHICTNHAMCLKYQDFNVILENQKAIAQIKKYIKICAPHFKGNKEWMNLDFRQNFNIVPFDESVQYNYRFMTLTFDPKKFSFNELSQPEKLLNYVFNAIYSLKDLFSTNPIIVVEFHKSGIPHIHMNYSTSGPLQQYSLMLRLKYYLSKDLRNRHAVHDRIFNESGIGYIKKSNNSFYNIKEWQPPADPVNCSVNL